MRILSLIFLLLIICIFPVQAKMTDFYSGKVAVHNSNQISKTKDSEFLDGTYYFYKYKNKIKFILNDRIFYIIDIRNDDISVINEANKTVMQGKIADFLKTIPPPLYVFQDISSIKKYFGGNKLKISFIPLNKKKVKIIEFRHNEKKYIIYINDKADFANKLIIQDDQNKIFIEIKEYKPLKYNNSNLFLIPNNFHIINFNKLKKIKRANGKIR